MSKNVWRMLGVGLGAAVLGVALLPPWVQAGKKPGNSRPTNRLAKETSPYLLQHAHNPVDWYPWGPEAFERAKKEGKPVFLSVGYSACHWCHVMERESFENEDIARLLNEGFVCVKVDREERPDVDEIYMAAVQALTGQGGWPMSVFLNAEGKPFHGGSYFRPIDFAELLRAVDESWKSPAKRKQIDAQAERVAQSLGGLAQPPKDGGDLTPAVLLGAGRAYLDKLDEKDGGFGGAPKFPPSTRLAVLLSENRKKPDAKTLKAVTLTLDRMARGGMYDQVGGGFHRYSTDAKWLVPHFEKMLYDNALLAQVYLEGYKETRDGYYLRIARETLDFMLREMRDPKGGFWSSLDADSPNGRGEKEEGRFYVWSQQQILDVLGKADAPLFNRLYGVSAAGNWEGRNIPNLISRTVEAEAKALKQSPAALWRRLDGMRAKLLAARSKRPRPALDDKVLANWNGLAISALASGYEATGDKRYRQAAETAADFVLTSMREDGRLLHSYRDGRTQPQCFLEDYSFLIAGLLDLHRATGDKKWLAESEALARVMARDFWDEPAGTLFSTPRQHEALLTRLNTPEDNATPSGLSMAVLDLIRLSRATGDAGFRAKAQRVLAAHSRVMKRFPDAVPTMLLAAHAYFTPDDSTPGGAQAGGKTTLLTAKMDSLPSGPRSGMTFEVTLRLTVADGWHVNSDKPADPNLIPTRIEATPGPFTLVSATYPPAKVVKLGISQKPVNVFTGETIVTVKLQASAGAESAGDLRLKVKYQACNDSMCQRPMDAIVSAPFAK